MLVLEHAIRSEKAIGTPYCFRVSGFMALGSDGCRTDTAASNCPCGGFVVRIRWDRVSSGWQSSLLLFHDHRHAKARIEVYSKQMRSFSSFGHQMLYPLEQYFAFSSQLTLPILSPRASFGHSLPEPFPFLNLVLSFQATFLRCLAPRILFILTLLSETCFLLVWKRLRSARSSSTRLL